MLLTIKSSHGTAKVSVASYAAASVEVRRTIECLDLTAGCGGSHNVFKSAVVTDGGKKVATISYNGRVWDVDGKEIV